jgi:hypothetical protein
VTPPTLAGQLHSLPPMLHMQYQNPMSSCSKGSRGLSVPMRESGIFTAVTVSPSPSLRQRPSCYTIRAGRNLPDKEFRYLRTVIVTAAVYWGFGSKLRLLDCSKKLTPPLNLPAPGRCQSLCIALRGLAETCVFSKQSPRPLYCDPVLHPEASPEHILGAPLLPKLRGHFA